MSRDFYKRLRKYYHDVGKVLRGEANVASVFPNSTDVGLAREQVYVQFLQQHAPSKCNVFLGGFLFHEDGTESKQLDVIATTDTTPRFDFYNLDGKGKSFSPVEGTLGVVSVKSTLDKKELYDALENLASIPPMQPLDGRIPHTVRLTGYEDWPYKIIYASSGIMVATLLQHIKDFYKERKYIPITRRPNLIHVAGKYAIFRVKEGLTIGNSDGSAFSAPAVGEFHPIWKDPDVKALVWAINELQKNAFASTQIFFKYDNIVNKIQ